MVKRIVLVFLAVMAFVISACNSKSAVEVTPVTEVIEEATTTIELGE